MRQVITAAASAADAELWVFFTVAEVACSRAA